MGTLDNGAVGSPTQLMLDIEIRKAEFKARQDIVCDEQSIMYEDLCESIRSGGEFLTSDHTLEHYKEMWSSSIFRSDAPSASWPGDERGLLDLCDERWRETVKSYVPPLWPMEKMKELDRLVANVRKEMLQ
jgi:trimethylamine:corrinoid methyltransferase-like protein